MGRYLSLVILGIAAVLSTSILPRAIEFFVASLGNLTPILDNTRGQISLVMLVVVAWSIRAEISSALIWAFIGGILIDLFSILPLGTSSAGLIIIAYAANGFVRQIYRVRLLTIISTVFFASLGFYAYTYVALLVAGHSYDVLMQVRLVLIPTILYNLAAALPVYGFVRIVQRRVWKDDATAVSGLARGD